MVACRGCAAACYGRSRSARQTPPSPSDQHEIQSITVDWALPVPPLEPQRIGLAAYESRTGISGARSISNAQGPSTVVAGPGNGSANLSIVIVSTRAVAGGAGANRTSWRVVAGVEPPVA